MHERQPITHSGPPVALVLVTILLLGTSTAALARSALVLGPPAHRAFYVNPVYDQPFPDPIVLKVGHDFYAYGTVISYQPGASLFPILHSTDLVHWHYVMDALPRQPLWGYDDWWAPSVLSYHGTYATHRSLDLAWEPGGRQRANLDEGARAMNGPSAAIEVLP